MTYIQKDTFDYLIYIIKKNYVMLIYDMFCLFYSYNLGRYNKLIKTIYLCFKTIIINYPDFHIGQYINKL